MRLDLTHEVHAVDNLSEYNVLTIQPRGHNGRDEELRNKREAVREHITKLA